MKLTLAIWARAAARAVMTVFMTLAFAAVSTPVFSQDNQLRIAAQYGIAYLPFIVMERDKLIEKHAKRLGVEDPRIEWVRFGGGSAINEALISGNADVAAAGAPVFLTVWDKTKGNMNVRGLAGLNHMPIYLNTTNPNVKSIEDFTENDRIALPSVKVSYQALTLQMAAENKWGKDNYEKLDHLTVSMPHPDAQNALLMGNSEITAHFASPPYMFSELENEKVHKVLSSYDVYGEPVSFNIIYTTTKSYEAKTKLFDAFLAALSEAMDYIKSDTALAAKIYVERTKSKLDVSFVEKMVSDPSVNFTPEPRGVMKAAEFMAMVGRLNNKPESLKQLFFIEPKSGS